MYIFIVATDNFLVFKAHVTNCLKTFGVSGQQIFKPNNFAHKFKLFKAKFCLFQVLVDFEAAIRFPQTPGGHSW